MSTAMQKIILKEFADSKNVTVRQIAEGTGISESIVNSMYNTGEFDGNDININDILEIMDFLGIEKISSLKKLLMCSQATMIGWENIYLKKNRPIKVFSSHSV